MRRVAVIGSSGAGKSTLARALGEKLGLPVIHLDLHFWAPGWKVAVPDRDRWREVQRGLLSEDRWIVDGNYGSTLDERLPLADTVVFLDLPRRICLARVLRRVVAPKGSRPDLPEGCPEQLDLEFLRWVWGFPRDGRPKVIEALEAHSGHAEVITLRTPREVDSFLRSL